MRERQFDPVEPSSDGVPIDVLVGPENYLGWLELDLSDPIWDAYYGDEFVPVTVPSKVLLAEAEVLLVGGRFAQLLYEIDPTELDEAGHALFSKLWQRLENSALGHKLASVGRLAGPARDPDAPPGEPDFTDCEVAVALNVSAPAARRIVDQARALTTRLRATLASVSAGAIGFGHVQRIVDATEDLTGEQAARVEALVLPKAPRQAPGQFQASLRRAVARVAPDRLDDKQRKSRRYADVDVTHNDDGTAHLAAWGLSSVDAAVVDKAVHAWARAQKKAGDPRTVGQLRAAALPAFAEAYLTGGMAGSAPRQHGRPITVLLNVDLTTFLGLTDHPVEILGTGALIPAAALRDLIPDAELRRIITDPMTGHLLDYGRRTYRIPADLAAFITARWVNSSGPGSTGTAGSGDIDHGRSWDDDGRTDRANLHPPNRHWHRAKTIGGWSVTPNKRGGWTWTSPLGQTHDTAPHDYRLGP